MAKESRRINCVRAYMREQDNKSKRKLHPIVKEWLYNNRYEHGIR